MKLRLFTIACSIITCSLSSNEISRPQIVHPNKGPPICIIGEKDCAQPLKDIHWYMTYVLNVERFRASAGYYENLPIATDMLFMEIDEELTRKSQTYAETCLINNQMESCPLPEESQEGDVSVFVTEYERDTGKDASSRVASVLQGISLQIKRFSQETLKQLVKTYEPPEEEPNFHHLAKLIHADVWKVGCGLADFLIEDNKFKEVIVCSYGPPKLHIGKKLFIAGCVPCSNCPLDSVCEKYLLRGLCKVKSGKFPLYNDDKEQEENICFKPEVPKPNPSIEEEPANTNDDAGESAVWKINQQFNAQKCSGINSCHAKWTYDDGKAYINLNEICMSITAFDHQIHIKEDSCFVFMHKKAIEPTSKNVASVIAFAFEINNPSNYRVNEAKYGGNEVDFKPIYLDLPWKNIDIYVGFGTRSDKDEEEDWYEIQAKNFKIEMGLCPSQPKDNTL